MKKNIQILFILFLGLAYFNTTIYMDGVHKSIGLAELVEESEELLYSNQHQLCFAGDLENIISEEHTDLSFEEYRTAVKSVVSTNVKLFSQPIQYSNAQEAISRYISFQTQHFRNISLGYIIYLFRLKPF